MEVAELLAPRAPHDAFSFDELANAYNFRLTSDRRRIFSRIVIERARALGGSSPRVLDVGCGGGIGRSMDYLRAIRSNVGDLWGLEPDPDIADEAGLFDHFQNSTMEAASLPADSFDLVYAYMVMEHVEAPDEFLRAVHRALRPGGEFVFITPNGRHYFTRIASLLHKLKLDEVTLRVLRRKAAEDYHYPVRYRFNHAPAIARLAAASGFDAPRFAYLETEGPSGYLGGVLKPFFWAGSFKRRVIKRPDNLVAMVGILRKST